MALHSGAEPDSTNRKQPLNFRSANRGAGEAPVESDARFYRRRANEEIAAAGRAVTEAARERRMVLAGIFLDRLKSIEASELDFAEANKPVFSWKDATHA